MWHKKCVTKYDTKCGTSEIECDMNPTKNYFSYLTMRLKSRKKARKVTKISKKSLKITVIF